MCRVVVEFINIYYSGIPHVEIEPRANKAGEAFFDVREWLILSVSNDDACLLKRLAQLSFLMELLDVAHPAERFAVDQNIRDCAKPRQTRHDFLDDVRVILREKHKIK